MAHDSGARSIGKPPHIAVKTKVVGVRMTIEQFRLIDQRAKRRGMSTAAWLRSIATQAARSNASEGYLRIREPDGVTT
jgi:hypothetical protein